MESITIIENKNKLISLVQDIVNEYNIMSELKIQKNCESSLEHRRLNDLIRDQEKNTQEQQKLIENSIDGKKLEVKYLIYLMNYIVQVSCLKQLLQK